MTEHSLMCLVVTVFLLRTAFSRGPYCTNIDTILILKFCQTASITSSIIYLDTSGFPVGDIGECPCRLSSLGSPTSITIAAVPMSRQGDFQLEVAGKTVNSPVQIPYKPEMEIILRKKSAADVVQCLSITGDFDANSSSVMLTSHCFKPAIVPTATEPTDIPTTTVQVKSQTDIPTTTVQPKMQTALVAGVSSTFAVLMSVTIVLIIVLIRKSQRKRQTENPASVPDYCNTMNRSAESRNAIPLETSLPNTYVNTQLEVDTSGASNAYESLKPCDQGDEEQHYKSIVSDGKRTYVNAARSTQDTDAAGQNTDASYTSLQETHSDEHVYQSLKQ